MCVNDLVFDYKTCKVFILLFQITTIICIYIDSITIDEFNCYYSKEWNDKIRLVEVFYYVARFIPFFDRYDYIAKLTCCFDWCFLKQRLVTCVNRPINPIILLMTLALMAQLWLVWYHLVLNHRGYTSSPITIGSTWRRISESSSSIFTVLIIQESMSAFVERVHNVKW